MAHQASEVGPADSTAGAWAHVCTHKRDNATAAAHWSAPVLTDDRLAIRRARARVRVSLVFTAGLAAGLIGWVSGGRAVVVPLAVVAALSVAAGVLDARTLRIPNLVIGAGLIALTLGAPLVALADARPLSNVAGGAAAGWFLAGTPVLIVLWLLRPAGIGGGDWKLITVQSAAVGLLAPYTAPLILLGGGLGGAVYRLTRRRSGDLPLGPGLAVGYLAALVVAVSFPELLGGSYR